MTMCELDTVIGDEPAVMGCPSINTTLGRDGAIRMLWRAAIVTKGDCAGTGGLVGRRLWTVEVPRTRSPLV